MCLSVYLLLDEHHKSEGLLFPRGLFVSRIKQATIILYHCEISLTSFCAVPENIHTPPQKRLEFLGGGGWGFYETNWNSQRGREVLEKIPYVGEVWIFSGTTLSLNKPQLTKNNYYSHRVFIKHQRSENPPATAWNFPAKFH